MKSRVAAVVASLAAMACGLSSGENVSGRTYALVAYGNCPPAEWVCTYYHGPESALSALCPYEQCFEMNHGSAIRVTAADELGPFPDTWFVWAEEVTLNQEALYPCVQTPSGKKTRLQFPGTSTQCTVDIYGSGHVYHEHFVSNPATGCMGWVECVEALPLP